jgi:hypothetical protein
MLDGKGFRAIQRKRRAIGVGAPAYGLTSIRKMFGSN